VPLIGIGQTARDDNSYPSTTYISVRYGNCNVNSQCILCKISNSGGPNANILLTVDAPTQPYATSVTKAGAHPTVERGGGVVVLQPGPNPPKTEI
jgi:hypothetical protein